ncbi:MAG: GNAT family N-acetyltransferase [Gemmatimonadetes bacterium]|nr:GNAT family N-acetyltransferase [Gemmatimonadota bacterium]
MSLLRIETPRLLLRPFSPADASAVVQLDADPDVIRFMRAPQYPEAEMAEVLSRYAAHYENGFGMLAGVLKATDTLVGRYGVQRITVEGIEELEVTYSTRREYRRRGYALEATQAVLEAAWREGVPRLVGCIAPDNDRSVRLAERLGLRFERDVVYKETEMRMYAIDSPASG